VVQRVFGMWVISLYRCANVVAAEYTLSYWRICILSKPCRRC